MSKKERIVAAIENGTVIDHIPADKTYEVANILKLQELNTPVTIGQNYISKKLGRKGIIKVENKYFTDAEISQLSVVAHKVVLSIIKDYEVIEKKTVNLPTELVGIVKCNNPKCITNNEPMQTYFSLVDAKAAHPMLRCRYCDKVQDINKVKLETHPNPPAQGGSI